MSYKICYFIRNTNQSTKNMTFSAVTNTLLIMENNLVYMAVYCSKQKGGYEEKTIRKSELNPPSYFICFVPPYFQGSKTVPHFDPSRPFIYCLQQRNRALLYSSLAPSTELRALAHFYCSLI